VDVTLLLISNVLLSGARRRLTHRCARAKLGGAPR
jgi:hypothetical protein